MIQPNLLKLIRRQLEPILRELILRHLGDCQILLEDELPLEPRILRALLQMALQVEDLHLAFERVAAVEVGRSDDPFGEEEDSVDHIHTSDEGGQCVNLDLRRDVLKRDGEGDTALVVQL